MEPLIHKYLCEKNGWPSITDDKTKETAFFKGLKYHAPAAWKGFLHNCDVLRNAGINIILNSHSQTIKVNPPDSDEYDKYVMKIDKHSLAVVEEWADIIGFYNKELFVVKSGDNIKSKGKASTSNNRILHLSGQSAAMISGNSFGLTDIVVELDSCPQIMEWILTGPYKAEPEENTEEKTKTKKGDK